jgi:hypothetical protein
MTPGTAFGLLDIVVANAGLELAKPLLETTLHEFEPEGADGGGPEDPHSARGAGDQDALRMLHAFLEGARGAYRRRSR